MFMLNANGARKVSVNSVWILSSILDAFSIGFELGTFRCYIYCLSLVYRKCQTKPWASWAILDLYVFGARVDYSKNFEDQIFN